MEVLSWLFILTVGQVIGFYSLWKNGVEHRHWSTRAVYMFDMSIFLYKMIYTHIMKGHNEDNFMALAFLSQGLQFMHLPVTYLHRY